MIITAQELGKRYRYEWIFKGLSDRLEAGQGYAITGGNGSGKSTLLQVLSGHLSPSKGTLRYEQAGKALPREEVYQHLSYAAPYIELLEEYTLKEAIAFHYGFKTMQCPQAALIDRLGYPKTALRKPLKYFSSGMQQRLKLALAIAADTAILLLDEPTITLDRAGMDWYSELMQEYAYQPQRLTIVASNVAEDYAGCTQHIDVLKYKPTERV